MAVDDAQSKLNITELVLLFTGDSFTQGCPSVKLVMAICEMMQPENLSDLRTFVFCEMPNDRIHPVLIEVLEHGHQQWLKKKG